MNLNELKKQSLSDENFISQIVYKIKNPDTRSDFFKVISSIGSHWQENPTPLDIIRKMVEKTSLDNKKILVLFNIEFLQVLIEEKNIKPENIYYVADNKLEYLCGSKIFKVQSYHLKEHNVASLKQQITGLNMKFDLVFSNPPYNKGIDIKILNEIVDVADEIIAVHPSTWLLDNKGKTKYYQTFKDKIDTHVKSFEMFNGNPIFNIGLYVPIVITHYDTNYHGDACIQYFDNYFAESNINNVTKFGDKWTLMVKDFNDKIAKYIKENNGSVWNKNVKAHDDKHFYCQLAVIRGNEVRNNPQRMHQDDFYTMCMKNDENKGIRQPNLTRPGNPQPTFEFDTEFERDNFLNYLKTDFARFCLCLLKTNNNLAVGEMELIPWLDFTEEWDDEKLFKKFNVSQELQDYIREFLPDYYGIRK